jgi:hypothetical protein
VGETRPDHTIRTGVGKQFIAPKEMLVKKKKNLSEKKIQHVLSVM